MADPTAAELIDAALRDAGQTLTRVSGRKPESGLLEVREFGPALARSLTRVSPSIGAVSLNRTLPMIDWTRPTSQVDLVIDGAGAETALAAELKVWDISHQLFDLAKVCCMLQAGVEAGFLICVAKRRVDFDREPAGELFPAQPGETRVHDFAHLVAKHHDAWRHHAGLGGPEPTAVPRAVATTSASVDVEIRAYPGHVARAAQVSIVDPGRVPLLGGWPAEPRL